MINIYVNGNKCNRIKENKLKTEFGNIDDMKLYRWNDKNKYDNSSLSVYFVSPLSYNQQYISYIIKMVVDNPKNTIFIVDKFDYNEHNELVSYTKEQKNELENLKYAFLLENEGYFDSIFSAVKYAKKIKK